MKKKKIIELERINSRVRPDQRKFIKKVAKKQKIGEGELHRDIIDFYISHYKAQLVTK